MQVVLFGSLRIIHRLCDNGTIPQEEVKRIIEEQEKKENGN